MIDPVTEYSCVYPGTWRASLEGYQVAMEYNDPTNPQQGRYNWFYKGWFVKRMWREDGDDRYSGHKAVVVETFEEAKALSAQFLLKCPELKKRIFRWRKVGDGWRFRNSKATLAFIQKGFVSGSYLYRIQDETDSPGCWVGDFDEATRRAEVAVLDYLKRIRKRAAQDIRLLDMVA